MNRGETLNHERITEDVRELAALYALGSLTQNEARSFELHIQEGCTACEAELRRIERIVSGIGFSADEAEVPGKVRELLRERMNREPQSTAASPQSSEESKDTSIEQQLLESPRTPSVIFQSQEKKQSGFPWIYVAAFALLAVLGFTLFALNSARGTNSELQEKLSAAQADYDELNILLDSQKERSEKLNQVLSIVEKPGVRMARLVKQTGDRASSGTVLEDAEQNRCLVIGLFPRAEQDKNYFLWFVTPAARIPAGILQPDATGRIFESIAIPETAATAPAVLISLEADSAPKIPAAPYYAVGRFN
jgi:anti-sigma-K factor RskA